ncbi:MAG: universal stress protein [Acidimicrobiia bacterium]
MTRPLIAAFDATPASFDAVRWAAVLAERSGAELALVHATRPDDPLAPMERERVRADAEGALPAGAADRRVHFVERTGDPATVVADVAREIDAELVVVGHRPPGGAVPAGHGHERARELIQRSGAAVAVVPAHSPPPSAGTAWLLDVADGDGAGAGVGGLEALGADRTQVIPVLAYDPTADTFPHPEQPAWSYPGEARARNELAASGLADRLVLEAGEPADVLRQLAERGPSIIAVRTRQGLVGTLRGPGRTADALLEDPPCPVLLLPQDRHGDRADEDEPETASLSDGATARFHDVDAAEAAVQSAEQRGGDASRLHIEAEPMQDRHSVQANDHANLANTARPVVLWSVIGGAVLAAVLLVVSLVIGASLGLGIILTLGGAIVGSVLGALAGLYTSLAINRDVIDLRGREPEGPVVVREKEHAGSNTDVQGVGYGEEDRARRASETTAPPPPGRR